MVHFSTPSLKAKPAALENCPVFLMMILDSPLLGSVFAQIVCRDRAQRVHQRLEYTFGKNSV